MARAESAYGKYSFVENVDGLWASSNDEADIFHSNEVTIARCGREIEVTAHNLDELSASGRVPVIMNRR